MSGDYLKTSPDSPNVEAVPPMLPALKAAEGHEIAKLRAEVIAQRELASGALNRCRELADRLATMRGLIEQAMPAIERDWETRPGGPKKSAALALHNNARAAVHGTLQI